MMHRKNSRLFWFWLYMGTWLLLSCNGNGTGSTEPSADKDHRKTRARQQQNCIIQSPQTRERYIVGQELPVIVGVKEGRENPDSLRIFWNGSYHSSLTRPPWKTRINTEGHSVGNQSLRISAYYGEEKPEVYSNRLVLYSDLEPDRYRYRVANTYPHDEEAFTQGLLYHKGLLYEGTGQEGASNLRKVELETGEVLSQLNLPDDLFGEGICLHKGRIYQLTWRNNVGFVYDMETFRLIRKLNYQTEGWGITSDGENLVMSDGTHMLYFIEPEYFTEVSRIEVYDQNGPVQNLNELEYIKGEVWANIFTTDELVRIDPATGKVLAYVNLTNLLPQSDRRPNTNYLNGIAWDAERERLFVTGKYWPKLFEIKLVEIP